MSKKHGLTVIFTRKSKSKQTLLICYIHYKDYVFAMILLYLFCTDVLSYCFIYSTSLYPRRPFPFLPLYSLPHVLALHLQRSRAQTVYVALILNILPLFLPLSFSLSLSLSLSLSRTLSLPFFFRSHPVPMTLLPSCYFQCALNQSSTIHSHSLKLKTNLAIT